jgi:hypothetical protein
MVAYSFVWVEGRTYKNEVLKILFGPKWEEVTGGLRKLHNEVS